MKIQCSDMTYRLLRDAPRFDFDMVQRGGIQVKGKGAMNTWWINSATKRVGGSNKKDCDGGIKASSVGAGVEMPLSSATSATTKPSNVTINPTTKRTTRMTEETTSSTQDHLSVVVDEENPSSSLVLTMDMTGATSMPLSPIRSSSSSQQA